MSFLSRGGDRFPMSKAMQIAVVGSGYVGLVAAVCFAEMGHEVICVDNDERKVAALQSGDPLIHENHLPELLERYSNKRVQFTCDLAEATGKCDVVFIAVGTPQSDTGDADLSYVEAVAGEIARHIKRYKVIVEKSTVPVYTNQWIRRVIERNGVSREMFDVASNPEFLREGTAVADFLHPDRIVIGVDDDLSASLLQEIYRPLTSGEYYRQPNAIPFKGETRAKAPIIVTTAKSAELIKHASNAFLAMKISFINAVANISEAVGADIQQVCAGIGSDSRIGPKFLNAGVGYGGSCFPKDVQAFHAVATQYGYDFGLLTEVMRINDEQRRRFLKKVRAALWTLRGKKLGVLGLAFKGDTDDIRESPAIGVIEALLKEGAQIRVFDPAATTNAKKILPEDRVTFAQDPYDAATACDALLILTEWKEFASLDLSRLQSLLKYPTIIDGRNLYDPRQMADAGFIYHSIGRAPGVPPHFSAIAQPSVAEPRFSAQDSARVAASAD